MENIITKSLEDAFLPRYKGYALSVIEDRALPDVRTGLKPSGRKILWDMYENGMKSTDQPKKCAKIVGSVLARVYPHGDTALYGALVRLGQEWVMRYPLVENLSNFGSRDGDGPAAYRYTMTKLTPLGELMCKDIDKDTVDYMDNFDNTLQEPVYLPCMWPQLICNGSNGIAVSMSTYIPPHNLTEVLNATDHMIDCALKDEEYTTEDIFRFIKGPDFPDGGVITNNKEMRKAIETGRGKIILKAKYTIEEDKKGQYIKITELPYQVSKQKLVLKIEDLKAENKVEGIREVFDLTKRGEICNVVVRAKKGASIKLIEKQLLAKTDMQISISYNITTLVDGVPKLLGIKDCLDEFLTHALSVIRKRTQFDLNKTNKRILILEGVSIATENIDRVIEIIRTEDDPAEVLMDEFELEKEQVTYILNMGLIRLSKSNEEKVENELSDLYDLVPRYLAIINDNEVALSKLKEELAEIKDKYGDARRTMIELEDAIQEEDLIKDEDLIITCTSEGNIKSVLTSEYNVQNRAGKGNKGSNVKDDEIVIDLFAVNSKDDLLFITNTGRCHKIKAYKIPKVSRTSKGKNMVNFMSLEEDEFPVKTLAVNANHKDSFITIVTDKGQIKRISVDNLSPRLAITKVITLIDGHEIVDAILTKDDDDIFIATTKGMSVRFKAEKVRPTGRSARGVIGIKLADDDEVIGLTDVPENSEIITVTEAGIAKATVESEFATKSRGCKGIKCHKLSDKTGDIINCFILSEENMIVATANGKIIRVNTDSIARSGRATTGTKLIKLDKKDYVVAAACIPAEDEIQEVE